MLKFGNCLQKSEKNSIWLATIDDILTKVVTNDKISLEKTQKN